MLSLRESPNLGKSLCPLLPSHQGYLFGPPYPRSAEFDSIRVPLDIPNYLWQEYVLCCDEPQDSTFAPYIMAFLNMMWEGRRPGELLTSPNNLVVLEVKKLKRKKAQCTQNYP